MKKVKSGINLLEKAQNAKDIYQIRSKKEHEEMIVSLSMSVPETSFEASPERA